MVKFGDINNNQSITIIHPDMNINVSTKFHGNPSSKVHPLGTKHDCSKFPIPSCRHWDTSGWNWVVDWSTNQHMDGHYHPYSFVMKAEVLLSTWSVNPKEQRGCCSGGSGERRSHGKEGIISSGLKVLFIKTSEQAGKPKYVKCSVHWSISSAPLQYFGLRTNTSI